MAVSGRVLQETGARWPFLALLAGYFGLQAIQRTLLGGSFEVDEAEMFVMAQEFHLGYGPQLPFYNWLQAAGFSLFGAGTFAVAIVKNLLLFVTYAGFYLGLNRLAAPRLAIASTLALLLLPNLSWEAQRAGSHTIAMLAVMGLTFWILVLAMQKGRLRHFLALGVALGLGGLSKYNFWLFPFSLAAAAIWEPQLRRVLADRRLLLGLGVAAAIVAGPYGWSARHLDKTLSSTWKFYDGAEQGALPAPVTGLGDVLGGSLAALVLLAAALLAARLGGVAGFRRFGPLQGPARWLLLAAGVSALVMVAGVVIGGMSRVQSRWLLPVYVPLAIGLALWLLATVSERAQRNYLRFCGLVALLILAAMADIRLRGAGSDSLEVGVLAEALEQELSGPPVVVADFYFGGNLKYHRPGWQIVPPVAGYPIPPGTRQVLVVFRRNADGVDKFRAIQTLDRPYRIAKQGEVTVPYRFEDEAVQTVRYAILSIENGEG